MSKASEAKYGKEEEGENEEKLRPLSSEGKFVCIVVDGLPTGSSH